MDWSFFWAVIGTTVTIGGTVIGLVYQIMRNFKQDVKESLKGFSENFEKHERRFEKIDQRLFLLCMGKSLPDILKAERDEERK